ncbi:MAG: helix-turn-helix domain-containing protein [Cyclobacteriaceae bacterium]
MEEYLLVKIGERIKDLRKDKKMKVSDLALHSGISKGMLSKIENARSIPSLPVLMSILQALKTEPGDFFVGLKLNTQGNIIHKKVNDYLPTEKEDAIGFLYHQILSKNLKNYTLDVVLLTLAPGNKRDLVVTDGLELKYMLKGEVQYIIGDEVIDFKEGETLFFDGRIPHVPVNKTDNEAIILVVYLLLNLQE